MDTIILYGVREVAVGQYEMFSQNFGHWVSVAEAKESMSELGAVVSYTPEEFAKLETIEI